jgi:hypothetical protein
MIRKKDSNKSKSADPAAPEAQDPVAPPAGSEAADPNRGPQLPVDASPGEQGTRPSMDRPLAAEQPAGTPRPPAVDVEPDPVVDLTGATVQGLEAEGAPAVERAADLYRSMIETDAAEDPLEPLTRWVASVQERLRELPTLFQQESRSLQARLDEFSTTLEDRLSGVQDRLRNYGSALDLRLAEEERKAQDHASGTEERISRLEQGRSDLALSLKEGMAETAQQIDSRVADEARRIDERVAGIERRIADADRAMQARLDALEARVQQVFGLFGQVAQAADRGAPPSASDPSGDERPSSGRRGPGNPDPSPEGPGSKGTEPETGSTVTFEA